MTNTGSTGRQLVMTTATTMVIEISVLIILCTYRKSKMELSLSQRCAAAVQGLHVGTLGDGDEK